MSKGRLEAFSDGVLAVIITIMVLELKPPDGADLAALRHLVPSFASYILSFVYIGIYWSNHHHMFQAVRRVNGAVLWANLHLLFWLSLVPFVTAWMGQNHYAGLPVAAYGVVLFFAAASWAILLRLLTAMEPEDAPLRAAVKGGAKEMASLILYAVAIATAFHLPYLAEALYALVALIWLIPDRRIERRLNEANGA